MTLAWRAGLWWVAALVAFNLFLHLPISDVFDGLARRFGFTEYDTVTRIVFLVVGLAAAGWIWRPSTNRAVIRRAAASLVVLIALAQSLLVVNGIEAIHYPQFALMAWLLVRTGLRLEVAWLTASGLGAVDEIWQWQTLPRAVPGYLDWNDIVLNAIGAALGVLIVVRLRRARVSEPVLPMAWAGVAVAGASVAALLTGPLIERPFYRLTPGGRWFHLLGPFEAVVCMAAIWWIVRALVTARSDHRLP